MFFRCMRQKAQSRRPPKYTCQSVWSFETCRDDIRTSFTISSATNWARDVSSPCKGLSANQVPKLYWKSRHNYLSQIIHGLLYFTLADNFGRTIIHQTPQALQGFLQTTPSRHQSRKNHGDSLDIVRILWFFLPLHVHFFKAAACRDSTFSSSISWSPFGDSFSTTRRIATTAPGATWLWRFGTQGTQQSSSWSLHPGDAGESQA